MGSENSPADRDVSENATAKEGIEGTTAEGRDDRELERVFDAPWQARAFAVALATTKEGDHSWAEFQSRLAAEVERTDTEAEADQHDADSRERTDAEYQEAAYYEQWLAALAELLVDAETLTPEEIDARTRAFAEGDRTAEEWVEGERDHNHGEGHSH
jgi:nitrile hydratase accessory protein